MEKHKGFIARLGDGRSIYEVNNRIDIATERLSATNWHRVPKDDIVALELVFEGNTVASLNRYEGMSPQDWYFSHSATQDLSSEKPKVLTRNIGIKRRGLLHMFRMDEVSGAITAEVKPL